MAARLLATTKRPAGPTVTAICGSTSPARVRLCSAAASVSAAAPPLTSVISTCGLAGTAGAAGQVQCTYGMGLLGAQEEQ